MTTADKRRALDTKIDGGIPSALPFPERNAAIVHLLRSLEQHWLHLESLRQTTGDAICEVAIDLSREGAHLCLQWMHEKIAKTEPMEASIETTAKDVNSCIELIIEGGRYGEMCDVMGMLWLEKIDTKEISPSELELIYTPEQKQYEAAQWLWRLQSTPQVPWPIQAMTELQTTIGRFTADDIDEHIVLKLNRDIVRGFQDNVREMSDKLWQLPDAMNLGVCTTSEFKDFWVALRTVAAVHKLLFNAVASRSSQAAVPIFIKEEWVNLLSELSGLDSAKVGRLVDYLTYDYSLTQKGKDKHATEAMSQPFFAMSSEQLALSCFFVLNSNAERNLFDLTSSKQPSLYDRLKKSKEVQWAEALAQRFRDLGIHAVAEENYPGGDIDLFVIDLRSGVSLVIQLKWLLHDRIKDGHVKEARKAFSQAKGAIDWIRANPSIAARKLGVSEAQLQLAQIHPMAVMKESILNGMATDPEVPILSGVILDFLIDETEGDIGRIWQAVFTDRSILPVEGPDFIMEPGFAPYNGVAFGGVRFKLPKAKLPTGKTGWKPTI